MRLPTYISVLFLAAIASTTRIPGTLHQPPCDDNHAHAHALFATTSQARTCLAALNHFSALLRNVTTPYTAFFSAMEAYEWTQNRLCRWQRLTQFPPGNYARHDAAFRPVREAWVGLMEGRGNIEKGVLEGWEGVRDVCWGGQVMDIQGSGEL
ncbi:hypothetical protein B0A55_01264 [Friedmanniomyces simplex]|uniref:Uncharacterized protein n=1 Tax=Friedmanniomyces simplex TaxID=329884 RepID=A0A4U0XY34_9PEZI|nr:hypothetical protein B0A55_01264 [Friedmanniomyces simplex]